MSVVPLPWQNAVWCIWSRTTAAAKSLQSFPTLRLQRWQPTRLPHPWDSAGKNTGVGCHFLLQCMKVKSESEVAQSCPTLATSWTAAYQAPLSMGFSRQKYWSGVPLPSLGQELHYLLIRQYNIFIIVTMVHLIIMELYLNFFPPPDPAMCSLLFIDFAQHLYVNLSLKRGIWRH